ncbi:hypothetical protein Tco_1507551 [Tanacetum coccineum]
MDSYMFMLIDTEEEEEEEEVVSRRFLANLLQEMDNPYITMEEYVQYKSEEALRNNQVYTWEIAQYELDFSSESTLSSQRVDKANWKNKTSLSEYDDEGYNVLDFARLSEIDEGDVVLDMTKRLRMEHRGDDVRETVLDLDIADTLQLRGLEPTRRLARGGLPLKQIWLITRPGLLLRGQSPKKVTMTDLFFLCSMDEGTMGGAVGGGAQINDHEGPVISPDFPQDAPVDQQDVQPGHVPHRHHRCLRYSAWMVDQMTELIESRGMRYERFDGSISPDTHSYFKRQRHRVRYKTDGASTSAQQTHTQHDA